MVMVGSMVAVELIGIKSNDATNDTQQGGAIDPFDFAANELEAFAGERGVRVMPTPGTFNSGQQRPMSQWKRCDLKC